ncbi:formate dehydrogenase subunit FdhD [Solidesulfovibrio carbinoliphilus subsp. oakridgensis]|uniref:Formate dehydrogenase subunit FdhD n=1 Tax=Solidesulfovibrio carbinoliphilus subsp. oakridgensis TaxID=694327 RepID=G7QDP0_9BACT|nr:formate dehydrogenase accessory sulfurtransferase FdhD [Solidesulfovibrio carbinoliphilus]EHJ46546.1 formate dehydrogenase subunit FdhD [Solidesulfovibrio carbinoliphilus subsp. oakridgensis]
MDAPLLRPLLRKIPCRRFKDGRFADIGDDVATEIRVRLRVAGIGEKELLAAPFDATPLVLGHALLEMLGDGRVPAVARANGFSFDLDVFPDKRGEANPALPRPVSAAALLGLVTRFIAAPGLWDGTGCFHRAALYDGWTDTFVATAEDIGRHNCLDRLAGQGLLQAFLPPELILFLSCRVTASMMEKALRAGIRMVVSRSAVTGAAYDAAVAAGVTLVGFARDAEARFTVFTDTAGRVTA